MNNIQRAILNKRNFNDIKVPDITYKKENKRVNISPMIKIINKKEKNEKFKYKFTIYLIILLGFIATYN